MNKRKFRSTAFQEVDWSALQQKLHGQPVVVSVDAAKHDFYAALMTPDRTLHLIVRWQHPCQSRALVETLITTLAGQEFCVVMEPTGTYGDPLRGLFQQANVPVYSASPTRIHAAAEIYDGVPSMHDAKACYVIGRMHLEGNTQRWCEPTPERRTRKAQLKQLQQAQQRQQSSLNRLEALLARHWPEAPLILALDAASLLQLLAHYGSPAAIRSDRESARQLLQRVGRSGLKIATLERLLTSADDTVGLACVDEERHLIQSLALDILAQRETIQAVEQQLRSELAEDAMLARLQAVVGLRAALVLLAELGSPRDYGSAAQYLKALGLNLKERSSGKHKGRLKITKRGPGEARRYLYWAVLRCMKSTPSVRLWCDAKAQRDGGSKGKAIIAVMRKLVKALWHVGQGALYDPNRLFNPATSVAPYVA